MEEQARDLCREIALMQPWNQEPPIVEQIFPIVLAAIKEAYKHGMQQGIRDCGTK